jgi:diguanylate cyclase (GGDEF)-like protein
VTQASARIEHMAYHDPLTGLPNRALFSDRLRHAIAQSSRRPERVGIVSLDLDRFKVLNDGLGHEQGDQLLRAVARRLTDTLREGDTIARVSGDVFAVLLHVARAQDAFIVADKALGALREPFDLDGREVFVTASAGLAVCDEHVDGAETLLRQADAALHRAKAEGRGRGLGLRPHHAELGARADRARERAAPRALPRRARGPLPADGPHRHRGGGGDGGARPLEPPDPRPAAPGRVPGGRREHRAHRGHRDLAARRRLPAARRLAPPRAIRPSGCRSTCRRTSWRTATCCTTWRRRSRRPRRRPTRCASR